MVQPTTTLDIVSRAGFYCKVYLQIQKMRDNTSAREPVSRTLRIDATSFALLLSSTS